MDRTASFRAVKLRVVCVLAVLFAGLAWAGGATAAQEAVSSEDIAVRDQLIADQENLLNAYRCRFGADTHLVPGSCGDPDTVAPGAAPQNPTQQDIDARDSLIQNQEALLNTYRCRFDIDIHIVSGGCQVTEDSEETDEFLGPVPPLAEPFAEGERLALLLRDCGWWVGSYQQCAYANGRLNLVDQIKISRGFSELYGCDTTYMISYCTHRPNPGADIWAKRVELAEYQEACGYGRSRFGSNYWECSHDPLDLTAPARPEHNAEVVRLGREAYNCNFQVLRNNNEFCTDLGGVGGAIMRQIVNETHCQNGWILRTHYERLSAPSYCYHPTYQGNNDYGQTDSPYVVDDPAGQYTAVSAGYQHSCAIRTDNTITCWGENDDGQADAPAGQYTAVSAGYQHSCAIRTDKIITCWGLYL